MRSFRLMSRLGSASMNTHFRMAPTASLYQTKTMFPVGSLRMFSAGPPPLTVQQIEDRVLQLLKDFDKVEAPKLSLDAHFVNDLGLDSLDQVEITMALEDEFNIEIPDRDAEEIFTPRQAVEKIFANKNAM